MKCTEVLTMSRQRSAAYPCAYFTFYHNLCIAVPYVGRSWITQPHWLKLSLFSSENNNNTCNYAQNISRLKLFSTLGFSPCVSVLRGRIQIHFGSGNWLVHVIALEIKDLLNWNCIGNKAVKVAYVLGKGQMLKVTYSDKIKLNSG